MQVTGPREGDKEDCGHMVNEHCPEVLPLNITKELQFDRWTMDIDRLDLIDYDESPGGPKAL